VQLGWTITTIDGRPFTNAAMTDGQRPKSLGFEEVVVGQHDFCECGVQNAAVALALHAVIALIFVLHTMNTPLSVRDNPLVDDDYEGRHNPYYYEDYDDEGSGVTYMYLWFSRLLYMFMPLLCLVGLVWGIVKRQSVAFKVVLGCDALVQSLPASMCLYGSPRLPHGADVRNQSARLHAWASFFYLSSRWFSSVLLCSSSTG